MEKSKLFYPDCIFNLNEISLSTFLYFQEELSFTLHPTASLFLAKCDPFYFAKLIDESNYNWKNYFLNIFSVWKQSTEMIRHTYNLLSPLKSKKYLKGILLSYSRTEEALRENEDMVKSTDLSTEELLRIVNIPMASQELIAHILFEKFLEIYKYPIREKAEDIDELLNEEPITENIDYKELLNYCNHLFTNYTIEQALVNNYFYRLKIFQHLPDILLTNGNLINFLNRIPRKQDINSELSYYEGIDLISWEIFRQITTPYIEEKSPEKRIELIENFREQNSEEINNLKNKCMKLAEQYNLKSASPKFNQSNTLAFGNGL